MIKKNHIIVLKNIAGQCINEMKVQTFDFGAKINFCGSPATFSIHTR